MQTDHPKLKRALERNLTELNNCILKRRAYNAFLALKSAHGLDFFRICVYALQNDLYANAHRALDRHKDAASFWYIRNIAPGAFSKAAQDAGIYIETLEGYAQKIGHLRNRIHFHIDKRDLLEPSKAWEEADVTGNEFISLTEGAHEILRRMYLDLTGIDKPVPDYHGDDIGPILRAYKKA